MVGKWHLRPAVAGSSKDSYADPYSTMQQGVRSCGFDFVDGLYIGNFHNDPVCDGCDVDGDGVRDFSHNNEWVTQQALRFINQSSTAHPDSPFFLFMNPTPSHTPNVQEALELYNDTATPAGWLPQSPRMKEYCATCQEFDSRAAVWAASEPAVYANSAGRSAVAGVHWNDVALGMIYTYLQELGKLDDTIFIVSEPTTIFVLHL
jgi:arylsulfatase A-like enzyme